MAENGIISFLKRLTSPNAPSIGKVNFYAKDDDILYAQNSAGVENPLAMGGVWQDYTPTWTASTTNPDIGNGTLTGRYCVIGKLAFFSIKLVGGSTTAWGSGIWSFSLPIALYNSGIRHVGSFTVYDSSSGGNSAGNIEVTSGSTIYTFRRDGGGGGLNSTTPMTWASGDELFISGFYEIE